MPPISVLKGLALLALMGIADGAAADPSQRTLTCTNASTTGCEFSCASESGAVAFVYDHLAAATIGELSSPRALVFLQRQTPQPPLSLFVGDLGRCTLQGFADAAITRSAASPPPPSNSASSGSGSGTSGATVTVSAPHAGGGGALTWPALLVWAGAWALQRRRPRSASWCADSDPAGRRRCND